MSTVLSRRRFGPAGLGRFAVVPTPAVPAPVPHRRLADATLAEAVLVWSCLDCGAVGSLDPLPARCPDCTGEVATVVED